MIGDAARLLDYTVSERDFTAQVIEHAQYRGWMVAHFRPCLAQSGRWHTAVQGNGKGFPDLVLARGGRVLFVELKSARGRVEPEQQAWLACLPPDASHVWRPSDFREIEETLR